MDGDGHELISPLIPQAEGVLSVTLEIPIDLAARVLRARAAERRCSLTYVAAEIMLPLT